MTLTPELHVLALVAVATVLMWIPYMLARTLTRGILRTFADPADPASPPDPAWADRPGARMPMRWRTWPSSRRS